MHSVAAALKGISISGTHGTLLINPEARITSGPHQLSVFFSQLSSHPHLPHSGFCRWFCELNCKISQVHLVKVISAHPSTLDWEGVVPDSILEGVV